MKCLNISVTAAPIMQENRISPAPRLTGTTPGRRMISTPTKPAATALQLNIVGILLGLLLGLAWGAVIEFRDTSLRQPQDVRLVVGLPMLATIPVMMNEADEARAQSRRTLVRGGPLRLERGELARTERAPDHAVLRGVPAVMERSTGT